MTRVDHQGAVVPDRRKDGEEEAEDDRLHATSVLTQVWNNSAGQVSVSVHGGEGTRLEVRTS